MKAPAADERIFCILPFGISSNIHTRQYMKLIVYSAPWCRDCHVAKRWLLQNNIAFQEIDIEETPGAAEEVVRRTGKRAIPQFVLNGEWIQPYVPGEGFKYQEMSELFGTSQS
ncbi:MAG: glutaredoxin domain-containing protein [Candidatus Angelobacter sp.]